MISLSSLVVRALIFLTLDFEGLKKRGWKDNLAESLGKDFEVIIPKMPNPGNARYREWKIWFEKIIPFLEKEVVLIGHSMGGIFLAKYLSENSFPKNIAGLFLVSAPYCGEDLKSSSGGFSFSGSLEKINQQCKNVFIYHSSDDPNVSFSDFEKYKKSLPEAKARSFQNKGHFNQEEFPEIVENIKDLWEFV